LLNQRLLLFAIIVKVSRTVIACLQLVQRLQVNPIPLYTGVRQDYARHR